MELDAIEGTPCLLHLSIIERDARSTEALAPYELDRISSSVNPIMVVPEELHA